MFHPDGTPYWTPEPIRAGAEASITYFPLDKEAYTRGGTFLGYFDTLTDCAIEFEGEIINCKK